VKFVPVIMVAVMALAGSVSSANAQSGGSITGGNATYTLPTSGSDDAGTTVSSPWTSFRYSSFFAAIHGWMGGSSVSTPVRIGLPSARAVRFASAGRPDARVTRVTCP